MIQRSSAAPPRSSAARRSSVAIDAKRVSAEGESPRWNIFTHGGRNDAGIDAVDFARKVVDLGAGEILLTSMDRDGTKAGSTSP